MALSIMENLLVAVSSRETCCSYPLPIEENMLNIMLNILLNTLFDRCSFLWLEGIVFDAKRIAIDRSGGRSVFANYVGIQCYACTVLRQLFQLFQL